MVVEDHRMACADLRTRGFLCDRITHNEVMTSRGSQYLGALLSGDYQLLWISTPADWYVRTPGKRAGPHWERIRNMLVKARALRVRTVMFGPPGYMWKMGPIRDTIEDLKMTVTRMRLCSFGIKYNRGDSAPSGTCMTVATTYPISHRHWGCHCQRNTPVTPHVSQQLCVKKRLP